MSFSSKIYEEQFDIYSNISKYFGNIALTKLKEVGDTSMYYAKVGCLTCLENKYIAVVLKNDNKPIGYSDYLINLRWICFQTRLLDTPPSNTLRSINYTSENTDFLNEVVQLFDKNDIKYTYFSNKYPILQVDLLCDDEQKEYSNKGTMKACLDTFACMLTFTL